MYDPHTDPYLAYCTVICHHQSLLTFVCKLIYSIISLSTLHYTMLYYTRLTSTAALRKRGPISFPPLFLYLRALQVQGQEQEQGQGQGHGQGLQ